MPAITNYHRAEIERMECIAEQIFVNHLDKVKGSPKACFDLAERFVLDSQLLRRELEKKEVIR